jgi:hypothetical protein
MKVPVSVLRHKQYSSPSPSSSPSSSSSSYWSSAGLPEYERFEGAGDELAGVPFKLVPLPAVEGFDAREEGVADLLGSTFRFFDGGAFFIVVAVPFFFDGAGRFLEAAGCDSAAATSVVGTGTEDSRNGDCVLRPCSFFREATALEVCCSILRDSTGDDGRGVGTPSSLIAAGEEAISSTADVVDSVETSCGDVLLAAGVSAGRVEMAVACEDDEGLTS